MKLILNGVNGRYLRDVMEGAGDQVERVDAAVAYATDNRLLFDWCWDCKVPVRFWGRFDDGVPVSLPVLERFLKRGSARYSCKLVRCFHPKVIWWRGYGAYIGSGNLTQSAWWSNIEAGVFLTDNELSTTGAGAELEALFEEIDLRASPLTDELYQLMQQRGAELQRRHKEGKAADDQFLATDLVQPWQGLAQVSQQTAANRQRDAFLREWLSTLQIIRDVAQVVSRDGNRPAWVAADAPLGAQADQFLHAHYYQRTFDGQRADYESHFERHRGDPDRALDDAVKWWKGLQSPPSEEARTLNETAPFLRAALSEEAIESMTEDDFTEVLSRVHASIEYARRVPNKAVGLPDGARYTIPQKLDALSRRIWRESEARGVPVVGTLEFVLYGGSADEVPQRLWEALSHPKRKIEMLGVSSLGEIVGWAMPDRYPPRNGRTSKALRSLGHPVRIHVGA